MRQRVKETRELVEQGDADAQVQVARWHHTGMLGFPQSDTLAVKWRQRWGKHRREYDERQAAERETLAYEHDARGP